MKSDCEVLYRQPDLQLSMANRPPKTPFASGLLGAKTGCLSVMNAVGKWQQSSIAGYDLQRK